MLRAIALSMVAVASMAFGASSTAQPASAPASAPAGLLRIEAMPSAPDDPSKFQSIAAKLQVPQTKPAIARSDKCVAWRDESAMYSSALLFDESGGTGTGYDTLHVSFEGDETFAGKVETYKPSVADVNKEAPVTKPFDLAFRDVRVAGSRGRLPVMATVTFGGMLNPEATPDQPLRWKGRITPVASWAVGTVRIDGKVVAAAILDQNGNGRFNDPAGLDASKANGQTRSGDVLLLGLDGEKQLIVGEQYRNEGPARIPLNEYLVLNSGTYKVKVSQDGESVRLELTPARLPAGTVEMSEQMQFERMTLVGTKVSACLRNPPAEYLLPADTYALQNYGVPPYEVEAEEGKTVGRPFEPGKELTVTILLPDGKPAEGAEAIVLRPRQYIMIQNGQIQPNGPTKPTVLGPEAQLAFAEGGSAYTIVATHEKGWAAVFKGDLPASGKIGLEPWSRIEGTVHVGRKAAANQSVTAHAQVLPDPDVPMPHFGYEATTDSEGRFVLERVRSGKLVVGRQVETGPGSYAVSGHVSVDARPGETAKVQIGGSGRAVTGRIVVSVDTPLAVDLARSRAQIMPKLDLPVLDLPEDWVEMTDEQRQAWQKKFLESEEGKAFYQKVASMQRYGAKVAADGTFRVEDVVPGRYVLTVDVHGPAMDREQPYVRPGEQVGAVYREFVVPEVKGDAAEPLELGPLPANIFRPIREGDVAPPFEADTVGGKPLKLADYRGKHVLLVFWFPGAGVDAGFLKALRTISAEYVDKGRLEMIGLSMEMPARSLKQDPKIRGVTWRQGYIGMMEDPTVRLQYGVTSAVPPTAFLVSLDGKLLSGALKPQDLEAAVAKALAGGKNGPPTQPAATR